MIKLIRSIKSVFSGTKVASEKSTVMDRLKKPVRVEHNQFPSMDAAKSTDEGNHWPQMKTNKALAAGSLWGKAMQPSNRYESLCAQQAHMQALANVNYMWKKSA